MTEEQIQSFMGGGRVTRVKMQYVKLRGRSKHAIMADLRHGRRT